MCTAGGSVTAPQFPPRHPVVRSEVEETTPGREGVWIRAFGADENVGNEHRAVRRPIAPPQLAAVARVVCREEHDIADGSQSPGPQSRSQQDRTAARSIGLPEQVSVSEE